MHVRPLFQQDKHLLVSFQGDLTTFEERFVPGRGKVRMKKATFATYHPKTSTYGMHGNQLEELRDHLRRHGVSDKDIEIHIAPIHQGEASYLTIAEGVAPRDYQPDIIDFLTKLGTCRVLPLQTGKGKTFCALFAAAMLGVRTAVVMGAMHIETWKKDAGWIFDNADPDTIMVVKGGVKLRKLIALAQAGELHASIIIFSVNTIRDYLTEFEKNGHSGYGCDPINFYETLGVGLRITDEAHENLHFNFRHDIETSVPMAIYLSATLESNDPFTNRLYQIIYPLIKRYTGLKWDKYIHATALGYGLEKPHAARYKGKNGMYSHIVFEQYIMKDATMESNYYDMIGRVAEVGFRDVYQDGMKLVIFFASVDMCDRAAKYMADRFTQYTVSAYNAGHDDTVLHSHDIICTTLLSAGTGKDIKGLRTGIMTTALSSREKNIQVMGRLRDIQDLWPGVEPDFYYLVCKDIPKHVAYHNAKNKLFEAYAKVVKAININFRI